MWAIRFVVLPRLALMLAVFLFVLGLPHPWPLWAQGVLENPASGSFQSGIGVISGWKCTAGTVTITVDNGPPAQAAYGTSRADTQAVCRGKTNTGFGLLFNWNLLSDGQHTLRAFDNGVQFASATFTVTTLGQEFLTGANGTFTLQNFPQSGKSVTIRWQESLQNFVIVPPPNLAAGLYTGQPSQGGEIRFYIASTLDKLSPSPLVGSSGSQNAVYKFVVDCTPGTVTVTHFQSVPITNGHWEDHSGNIGNTTDFVDIAADCASSTCTGTIKYNFSAFFKCATGGTVSWTATATGQTAAAAEEETEQALGVIERYDQSTSGLQIEVDQDGGIHIIAP